VVCLGLAESATYSQEILWKSSQAAAEKAARNKEYDEAEKQYRAAIKAAEQAGPAEPQLATSLNNLAWLYVQQKRYADAEPLLKRALVIREKTLDADSEWIAQTLDHLGKLFHRSGRPTDAVPNFERAVAVAGKSGRRGRLVGCLEHWAWLEMEQRRYARAEQLYARSLAIREKTDGPEHPTWAGCCTTFRTRSTARASTPSASRWLVGPWKFMK
jgi:tetratricopeptide (TPR) repeat protein